MPEKIDPNIPTPGPMGLVAIAATLLAIPGSLLVLVALVYIWMAQPDLSQDSLLLLVVGMAVLSVGFFALAGVFAGILDVLSTKQRKGIGSLAITINTIIAVGVAALLGLGYLLG